MINVTGLWLNKDKNGKTYMSGLMGGVRVLVYKNERKTEDKHPDYNLVFAENKKKTDKAEPEQSRPDEEIPF